MKKLPAALVVSVLTACAAFAAQQSAVYRPRIDPSNFQATVDNPWWPLRQGATYHYVEREDDEVRDSIVTVTDDRVTIMGVECVIVHDRLTVAGKVREDTYDWYAQDKAGNVWYFGEDTREFDDRGHVSTKGSWRAGVNGAQPGIVMLAKPAPGPAYRQEYLRGEAEDMAQVEGIGDAIQVPYGKFAQALRIREWSELEPGSSKKWYARGIGFVRSQDVGGASTELVSMSVAP